MKKQMLCISALLALVGSCFAEPFRIVAYGDSITYGWIPNANPPSTRYGPEDRWPGALQKELGNNYQAIEEGLDGGTTGARDPGSPISGAQLDGSAYLPECHQVFFEMFGSADIGEWLRSEALRRLPLGRPQPNQGTARGRPSCQSPQ